jgi:hypothetical protein
MRLAGHCDSVRPKGFDHLSRRRDLPGSSPTKNRTRTYNYVFLDITMYKVQGGVENENRL